MKKIVQIIRLEGLLLLLAAITLFLHNHFQVRWFLLLLLVPDTFMIGYLRNSKLGALTYNIGHSLILPYSLLIFSTITDSKNGLLVALVWLAHIGMDRFFGYGLKLDTGFGDTHLGKIGKK